MKALILAGGFGKRLRPYTEKVPKVMIKVAGRPILLWQILWLRAHGIREFVLCVGYLRHVIMNAIGDGSELGISVEYAVEEEPLGTGGGLKNARELVEGEEAFLALNGDVITDLDPLELVGRLGEGYLGALALVQLPSPYGIVLTDEAGRVREFVEKPLLPDYWINAGVYCLRPAALDYMPDKGDVERTGFPELAKDGRLVAVKYKGVYWRAIDTYKDVEQASKELQARRESWPA
ncbi:MAG TPA: nucleotidyltransferase family protein [Candidatus Bathyarchaeota archaeon]|nr:MAG: nucleotidyltransferase [Candidatus Bathyarchaeota archaeon]HDJ25911.1 nucleotidyltransferase family protein [Candidatus Bathyarchaeota archaeon]